MRNLTSTNVLKKIGEEAGRIYDSRDLRGRCELARLAREDEKNARETVDWFASEICRTEALINRYANSSDLKEVFSAKRLGIYLKDLQTRSAKKFSKEAIESAKIACLDKLEKKRALHTSKEFGE